MNVNNIFVTSDWHLFHDNVIIFDKRPFENVFTMHEALIKNFNNTVKEDSIVYFLGDMGLTSYRDGMKKVLSRLICKKKILVLGNHDKGRNAMLDIGFDVVLNAAMITVGNNNVTMTHCPLRGVWRESQVKENGEIIKNWREGDNWHGESRHVNFSVPDFGQFHLHGHTHKPPEHKILGKQFDVGVRANNYFPVSISTIESWIALYNKENKDVKDARTIR